MTGAGIIVAAPLTAVKNNDIENFHRGIDLNYPATAVSYSDIDVVGNKIKGVYYGMNLYGTTLSNVLFDYNQITKISGAAFNLTDFSGTGTSSISNTHINPSGYSSVGTEYLGNLDKISLKSTTAGVLAPVVQYSAVKLLPSGFGTGRVIVQFGANNQHYAIIDTLPGAYTVVSHSTTINVDLSGSADWGVGLAGGNNLILQRRGDTISSVGTYSLKVDVL